MTESITILKYHERVIEITKVVKVTKSRKIRSYRSIVAIGDMRQKVGLGLGHNVMSVLSIDNAIKNGKKQLFTIPLNKFCSINSMVTMSYGAACIFLKPAPLYTGLRASGAIRALLEVAGIKNIYSKQLGSSNLYNNAQATIKALCYLRNFQVNHRSTTL